MMRCRRRELLAFAVSLLLLAPWPMPRHAAAADHPVPLFREEFDDLSGWEPLLFPKIPAHTSYAVEKTSDGSVLAARCDASASALVSRGTFPTGSMAKVRWRWKVEKVFRPADPTTIAGDDYPARVYLLFAYDPETARGWERFTNGVVKALYGKYPPKATLCYVWSSVPGIPQGFVSPATDRAFVVPLERGGAKAGEWVTEEVDPAADYRAAFGEDPPAWAAIAVMVDCDNLREAGTAWVDFIEVLP